MGRIVQKLGVQMGLQADPALGNVAASKVLTDLAAGQVGSVAQVFQAMRDGCWDDRYFCCHVVEKNASRAVLDAWCKQDPQCGLAHLLRGVQGIKWAWDARGSGVASTVSEKGFTLFCERLAQAEEDLARAADLDPEDPTPHAYLITAGKGQSMEIPELESFFGEAVRRDAHNLAAHLFYLWAITEKWGGSHDLMFEFAKSTADRAPEGAEIAFLPMVAHTERWLYFLMDGDRDGARRYVGQTPVYQDTVRAYSRSLGSPHHNPTSATVITRNHAAFWLFLVRDRERLAQEVGCIGKHVTEMPWVFAGGAQYSETYAQACQYARGMDID